jgi:hypothetical protein
MADLTLIVVDHYCTTTGWAGRVNSGQSEQVDISAAPLGHALQLSKLFVDHSSMIIGKRHVESTEFHRSFGTGEGLVIESIHGKPVLHLNEIEDSWARNIDCLVFVIYPACRPL